METTLPDVVSKPEEATRYYHHDGRMWSVSKTWVIGSVRHVPTYVETKEYDKLLAYCRFLEGKQ